MIDNLNEKLGEHLAKLKLEKEVNERSLLDKGAIFAVPMLSPLRFLPFGRKNEKGVKVREFSIHKFYLNTMDYMAIEKLKMKINLSKLVESTNPIRQKNVIIRENNFILCRIIAMAVLNRKWKIKIFCNILAKYFQARIHPENLHFICKLIDKMEDAANFIDSTVLIAGSDRVTMPKPETIEENPTQTEVKQ